MLTKRALKHRHRKLTLSSLALGWVLTVVAGVVYLNDSADASTGYPQPFCKPDLVLRDYLAPLSQVHKVPGFSRSGRLRAGPSALRIYPSDEHVVPIGRGGFEVQTVSELPHSSRRLDWSIESRLERINRMGRRNGVLKVRRERVSTVGDFGGRTLGFGGKVPRGFYRLTITISNSKNRVLDHYQELFRAMPARSELRLTTSFDTLSPGQVGYLRIDNLGTVPAAYGFGYRLFTGAGEEILLEGVVFPAILLRLHAGYGGSCFQFKVPSDVSSGKYVIKSQASDTLRKSVLVDATFYVE